MAMAAMMLASCSNDENDMIGNVDNLDSNVISLSSNINEGQITRANLSDTEAQNTQFVSGKSIMVEAYKTGTSTAYTTGNYTTGSGGSMTGSLYYPASGENIDICAYYPNTVTSSTTSFSVGATQTLAANYQSYDLMYATKLTNKAKGSTHALTFNHALSKIVVNLEAGNGVTTSDLTSYVTAVKIKNTKPTAGFSISAGAVGTITASGTAADIDITGSTKTSAHNGIIVPQPLAANTEFIAITYNGNTYTYKLAAATTFEKGKVYTYTITVNAAGISVSSVSITGWASGGSGVTGSVTL